MDIRLAHPSDAPALTDLARRLFRETYRESVPHEDVEAYVAQAFQPQAQRAEIETPGGGVMLGWEGPELAAYAQLRPSAPACPQTLLPRAGTLEVARFYLDFRWHGSGRAGELMRGCQAWAAASGYGGIWLQVWEENPRAIQFYRKQGFRDLGETTFLMGRILYRDRVMGLGLTR